MHQERLPGADPAEHQVVVRVGARFTTVVRTADDRPVASRILSHGPVLLAASQAEAANASGGAAARLIRSAARQIAERVRIEALGGTICPVIGTTGVARAVITFGSSGASRATLDQLHAATDTLGVAWVARKKYGKSHQGVEPMLIGSAVLGAILESLGATEIVAEAESPDPLTLQAD
jgi:hypothetical protein